MQIRKMIFLTFFGRSIRIPLAFRLWLLIIKYLHEKRYRDGLELRTLTFLIDPVFLQVQYIAHIYQFLLQLQVMWHVFPISVETYTWPELGLDGDGGNGKGSETFIINEGTQGDSELVGRIGL